MQHTPSSDNSFPPLESALTDPNGLLALGGELSCERLEEAYSLGIFPWYDDDQPIMWWSPDPRAVMHPNKLHLSRSLKKRMRQSCYQLTINRAFEQVIDGCAEKRDESDGTWITEEMREAYIKLHQRKLAHSFEVWDNETLIGGLYGVASGRVFSGESMFHSRTDASKIAFAFTCMQIQRWGFELLDCQIINPHLESLGVEELTREAFKQYLPSYSDNNSDSKRPSTVEAWKSLDWNNTSALAEAFINEQENIPTKQRAKG